MDSSWGSTESSQPETEELSPEQPEGTQPPGADSKEDHATEEAVSEPAREEQEGVQTGGLAYSTNVDGTRNYPAQEKPVETEDYPDAKPEGDSAE